MDPLLHPRTRRSLSSFTLMQVTISLLGEENSWNVRMCSGMPFSDVLLMRHSFISVELNSPAGDTEEDSPKSFTIQS